ncbi:hypothetical protein SAMCCGM7_Ch2810 [Sinorhizobium americanum CCGM7]|nr:hypothetical protein SAMCCGM7_Ch2810 [Sinorhizobium americanum CCGM7]
MRDLPEGSLRYLRRTMSALGANGYGKNEKARGKARAMEAV